MVDLSFRGTLVKVTVPPVRPRISRPVAILAATNETEWMSPAAPAPRRFPWRRVIGGAYLAGAALVLARLLLGSARMAWIARESVVMDGAPAEVLLTNRLAHIRRWDFPGQVAAQLACAVYWFHPLAWWAFQQLIKEREQACDDEVLNMGVKGTVYADHLLNIIRSARQGNTVLSPAIGMAQGSTFEYRLQAMLNPDLNRRAPGWRICAGSAVLGAVLLLPLAALRLPAQAATASIQGVVRDPSGAVIPHARILATNTDGSSVEAAVSGADGTFDLQGIKPGQYKVEVRAAGFAVYQQALLPRSLGIRGR